MTLYGLLHSDTPGSMCACHSPRLFAAYRVLRRLLMPRHSPYALISLNTNSQNYVLFSKIFSQFRRSLKLYLPIFLKFYFTKIRYFNFLFVVSLFNFQWTIAPSKHLKLFGLIWWAKLDSNQWPLGYQPSALTSWAISPDLTIFRAIGYQPMCTRNQGFLTSWAISPITIFFLVEIKGIEPLTPCLQSRCSPSWAKPPFLGNSCSFLLPQNWTIFRTFRFIVIEPCLP